MSANLACEMEDTYISNGSNGTSVYSNHHAIPKTNRQTIKPDLEKMQLPSIIINKAEDVYIQRQFGTHRGNKRRQLIFFCTDSAYKELRIPYDPFDLAKKCGIKNSEISKSTSMGNSVNTTYEAPLVRYSPKDFINIYYQKLSKFLTFEHTAIDDIYFIYEDVMNADPELYDEKPQTVAAAILVYYLGLQGLAIEKKQYKSIFGRSDMTINKIKKKVDAAYNS